MQSVAPLVTAVICFALGLSAVAERFRRRGHRTLGAEYATVAFTTAIAFLSMYLMLRVEGANPFGVGLTLGAALTGPAYFEFTAKLLERYRTKSARLRRSLWISGFLVLAIDLALLRWLPQLSVVSDAFLLVCLLLALKLMRDAARAASAPVDRIRLRDLFRFSILVAFLLLLEVLTRGGATRLTAAESVLLTVPPLGTLGVAIYLYFLRESLGLSRLLDARELLGQAAVFGFLAAALSLVYPATVIWLGADETGFNRAVNTLLATVVILILADPMRHSLQRFLQPGITRRGADLRLAFEGLRKRLAVAVEPDRIAEYTIRALREAGHLSQAGLYFRDPETDDFRKVGAFKEQTREMPESLPPASGAECMDAEDRSLEREALDRRLDLAADDALQTRLRTQRNLLDTLGAELLLPMWTGGQLAGWIAVSREEGLPPWSQSELLTLEDGAQQVATALDNTHALERLKERERLAALGRLAANLAHEVRNPLGAIKGSAQLLEGNKALTTEDLEFLDIIVEESERLGDVVGQFLDYARPLTVDPVPVELGSWLRLVESMVRAGGLPEAIDFVLDAPGLGATARFDPEKLRQVLLNLVRNSVEAIEGAGTVTLGAQQVQHGDRPSPGSSKGWRTLRGRLPNNLQQWLEIWIEDSGPGISIEHRDRLFVPFFTTKAKGTGLGLPACERLIQLMGGEIEIDTAPNRGTRFTLRIPDEALSSLDSMDSLENR